ncbi:Acyltransferase [Musa troglodytarum]|uniref:Acyltransferase n=1 Tax=Musa troglodytarum TaxID=320322 RepID=A0A9E7GP53_9LILI|nr:Acyltransferase [Musa troglodytarum]URE15902.1 Acyltransferase [Musa troglodytarum]URE15904.1 Acyltransferase [Musa troglodytarum]
MVDANGDITAPLFDVGPPEVALDLNRFLDRGSEAAGPPPENPFEFLGATPLVLPPMSPVDLFRNHTPHIAGLYEWCKTVLCLPIAAARLVLLGIAIAVGYVTTVVALYGWKDKERPMSRWRSRVMCVTRLCARFILFSFGRRYSQILKFIHGSSQFLSGSAQIKNNLHL